MHETERDVNSSKILDGVDIVPAAIECIVISCIALAPIVSQRWMLEIRRLSFVFVNLRNHPFVRRRTVSLHRYRGHPSSSFIYPSIYPSIPRSGRETNVACNGMQEASIIAVQLFAAFADQLFLNTFNSSK